MLHYASSGAGYCAVAFFPPTMAHHSLHILSLTKSGTEAKPETFKHQKPWKLGWPVGWSARLRGRLRDECGADESQWSGKRCKKPWWYEDFQFLPPRRPNPFHSFSKPNAFSVSTVTTTLFYKNLRSLQNSPPPPLSFSGRIREKKRSNNAFVTVNSSHTAVTCAAPYESRRTFLWLFEEPTSPAAEAVSFFHTTFVDADVALTQLFSVRIQIKEDGMCACVKKNKTMVFCLRWAPCEADGRYEKELPQHTHKHTHRPAHARTLMLTDAVSALIGVDRSGAQSKRASRCNGPSSSDVI